MKKIIRKLLTSISWAIAAFIMMSSGCGGEEKNVGYHYISIPGFDAADYMVMLNSRDEEMQYNAICYFYNKREYDQCLRTDSLKGTARYDTALTLYEKIYSLMDAKNSWVSSAAIHVINEFYYNRQAFVQFILNNNNPSLNVQLEIIQNITPNDDSATNSELFNKKIIFLQQQSSWLLQNGSYQLMDNVDGIELNHLMQVYKNSGEEYKKLLILDVLTNNITDTVFSFLTNEWATTSNERMKKIIIQSLIKANDPEMAFNWFKEHMNVLDKQMELLITNLPEEQLNSICSRLIVLAIEMGWKPSSVTGKDVDEEYKGEPLLYIDLFEIKNQELKSDSSIKKIIPGMKRIEDALLQNPQLKQEWLATEQRMMRYPLPQDMINHHQQLTEAYIRQTRLLLEQYGVDSSIYAGFIKDVNDKSKELYKEKIRKQK